MTTLPDTTNTQVGWLAVPAGMTDSEALAALLAVEDQAEAAGLLADDRLTCHTCRTWATPQHVDSPQHWAAIYAAAALVLEGEVVNAASAGPAAPVGGERLRRADRLMATAIGAVTVGAAGYGAGWVLPLPAGLPDELLWAASGVLVAGSGVYVAVELLRRWIADRRYAGNEVLAVWPAAEGGEPDGR